MNRILAAWKQHVIRGMHRHVATRRAGLVLRATWPHWRQRITTVRTVAAKYAACASQLVATARDMGFVARAAWRNGFRAKRARVATFEARLRLHTLWMLFKVLACPVVRRKKMNRMCFRRHTRRLHCAFDGLVRMRKLGKLQLLEFEMQARRECAEALDNLVAGTGSSAGSRQAPTGPSAPVVTETGTAQLCQSDAKTCATAVASITTTINACDELWHVSFRLPTSWQIARPAQKRVHMDIPAVLANVRALEHTKPVFCVRLRATGEVTRYSLDFLYHAWVLPLQAGNEEETKERDGRPCYPFEISQHVSTVQYILCGQSKAVLALAQKVGAAQGLDAALQAAFAACMVGRQAQPPWRFVGQALYLGTKVRPHNLGIPPEKVVSLAVDLVRMTSKDAGSRHQPFALDAVRKVVRSIQDVRGCESTDVPKDTIIWWAAITETTVRWRLPG
jgi:hypothetical protein